ncbi:MAG: kinase to dihydroxyacetone kinase [Candidatus Caccovivens sp.]
MIEFKFDTQLLIEGKNLSDEAIRNYITENIEGDCLLVVGDDEMIRLHFHTNTPWKVLEYCDSLGDIQDIVVENMERQANGLNG